MSDKLNQLEEQLKTIRKGLFLMGPSRIRAMSTHETEDMIIALEAEADAALKVVEELQK